MSDAAQSRLSPRVTPGPVGAGLALLLLLLAALPASAGNLTVRLVDHQSGAGLAGVRVAAHEVLADGTTRWVAARDTGPEGRARFDLPGLGAGTAYLLKARPYGRWLTRGPVTETGWQGWRVGTLPVTLAEADTDEPLAGVTITVLEKSPDGALTWVTRGTTDAGGSVRLDLPPLDEGRVYVLKAHDPFTDGQHHFRILPRHRGAVSFTAEAGAGQPPDRRPPQIFIDAPARGATVGDHGFTVQGTMDDEGWLRDVVVTVRAGDAVLAEVPALLDRPRGTWQATIGPLEGHVPAAITVEARARDRDFNAAIAAVGLALVRDVTPPTLQVASHDHGDPVPDGAFLVTGRVSDDTGQPMLNARLTDAAGVVLDARPLEVSESEGRWAYTAFASGAAVGALRLRLVASDGAGNERAEVLALHPGPAARRDRRLLDRISFGASPESLADLEALGADAYLDAQLRPRSLDDNAFETWLAGQRFEHPATHQLAHALYSRRQLREVLTWFWDNHFNTHLGSHGQAAWEIAENDAFRARALGRFRDLLGASARSPAMLRYLDNAASRARAPNENYARELLELHTLGIDGGYTEGDVVEVARAFTGWTVADGAFHFDAARHDTDAKQVLGHALAPGRGIEDGEDVLDLLADHPATARHVCGKLITLLVAEAPLADLQARCADTFLAHADSPDQLARVAGLLLRAPESRNAATRDGVRTPLEQAVAALRITGTTPELASLQWQLRRMGMDLFRNPVPTGYPERAAHWLSTHALRARLRYLERVAMGRGPFRDAMPDLAPELEAAGLHTVDGIVASVLGLVHGPGFSRADWALGRAILTEDGTREFRLDAPSAERRLRELLTVALALPGFHHQ